MKVESVSLKILITGPSHNLAWQEFRSGISNATSSAYADDKVWAERPAANALYGGRMTMHRQHEVVSVTQVSKASAGIRRCIFGEGEGMVSAIYHHVPKEKVVASPCFL